MQITWLGQAGLLFETGSVRIFVDPYLSDSVEKRNSRNYRRVPVNKAFFEIRPDIIVLTHDHLDHTDPDTLEKYLKNDSKITVLASKNAWNTVRKLGGEHNYVMTNRHTTWTEHNIKFTAVKAEHSDDCAVGMIIDDGLKKYYFTGDTLYNEEIFADIPDTIDTVFLPINGVGNNMNFKDAARFADRINAKNVVPVHFGMFDEIDPTAFKCKNKVIPAIYNKIDL